MARVRRQVEEIDETAEIILFEKGEYISYATCGLLITSEGDQKKERLIVQTPENMKERFNIDVR